ncbi:MAG: hypothetical protein Q8M37_09715 [Nevskia sp.]|nr:hypothetical protein [Nevskia sp.]
MKRCTCVSILMMVVVLGACQREVPAPAAAPVEIPEPAPDLSFCVDEADGDYLNPNSCRSLVICRSQQIAELRICPKGEVINSLSEQRPLRCLPLAESGLNADCSFKPLPLSDVLPE